MERCILCNKNLNLSGLETVTVKKKGVETLKECSIKRNDGLELMLDEEELVVHVSCRKSYINENMIKSYLKKNSQEQSLKFDYNLKCIFCNQDAKEVNSNKDRVRTIKLAQTKHAIEKYALKRGDSVSETIMQRIRNVDLVDVQAKYHRTCYDTFRFPTTSSTEGSRKRGRPECDHTITAMDEIYAFIQSHDEECQFTINHFKGAVSGECPDNRTIIKKIKEKYGDQVIVFKSAGKPTIFCFGSAFYKVLNDAWYAAETDEKEEKLRIVRKAASIILEDILTTPYDTSQYPPPDRFVESAKDDIPECLYTLLEQLIVKNEADTAAASQKCIAIAHAIITASRSRSCTSPV